MGRLDGEVAIVTGSTGGGIGTAIARRFATEAASVVVTGRSVDAGEAVAHSIVAAGGEAALVPADLTDRAACASAAAAAVERFGRLTVVVNDAAPDVLRDDGTAATVTDAT